jgi:hypothetical protein
VTLDVALKLTAILLLLRPPAIWWLAAASTLVAGLALLSARVRRSPWTWGVATVIVSARVIAAWPLADNHIYLLGYWCLAITLALGSGTPANVLRPAGRWLLGAAFAFAVLWKALLSPDYVDGRFFRVTLLTDDRFADVLMAVGGLTPEHVRLARNALAPLPDGAERVEDEQLAEPPAVRTLAIVATWAGLTLEAAIAVLCLLPARYLSRARHHAILAFLATTYAFAPVAGFGWLIAAMGAAQCREHEKRYLAAYVAAFFVVMVFGELPRTIVLQTGVESALAP